MLVGHLAMEPAVSAKPYSPAPPLPPPSGTVVQVSTESQLQAAVASLTSNSTIVIAAGTYNLTNTLYVNGTFSNVQIRGATNSRTDVVLVGKGMSSANDGGVPFGIWVGGNVQNLTIANLTIRDVFYHPIILNPGTFAPRIYNVAVINAGEQFIKANPDPSGVGVPNGIVEYSTFEYTTTSRDDYTNGVDVHGGSNWIIRHNLFRNIRAPQGQLAGPAILMWNKTSGTIVEGNTFINCQRDIALGFIDRTPNDHSGGVIRNNFIYKSAAIGGDASIIVFDSPNTVVAHNSIFASGSYPSPIEYRYATSGVSIINNLLDGQILSREGATATVSGNYTSAQAGMFVDVASGDLHLRSTATAAIDRGVTHSTADDWDGGTRPSGSARDIGGDEFGAGGTQAPAPPTNLRLIY
jgi:hypothetical protein